MTEINVTPADALEAHLKSVVPSSATRILIVTCIQAMIRSEIEHVFVKSDEMPKDITDNTPEDTLIASEDALLKKRGKNR
jgi:hypothetical protein